MPALTRLPNLYTSTIPPVNFPKMCLILDHLIPTLSQAIVPGGGVLGISSDGDDRRIFLGLKFSIPGFFWVGKFGLGSLI